MEGIYWSFYPKKTIALQVYMRLVNFSVTNFRSITTAHKVSLFDTTVLIGKNNEGKSNLLKALHVAMTSLQEHALKSNARRFLSSSGRRRDEERYYWDRDFPINLQDRKTRLHTTLRLEFLLTSDEIVEFKREIKSNLNGTLPIIISISQDNKPSFKVSKRGKGSKTLNQKSNKIAEFIANKIIFNYIPAIRTDSEASDVVSGMLTQQLRVLERNEEYEAALQTIKNLQQPILANLAEKIKEPLEEFLPGIKSVSIDMPDNIRRASLRRDFDIIIDDGTPTNLSYKGDGVKSLAALGLLKSRIETDGASIIAIEEPESHLHPAALHRLNEIIKSLGEENQVILTTHNPLFVDRHDIKSNIIVNKGKAKRARNIKEIRELLGVRASDNLTNASYVLVVEGEDDVISLRAILSNLSEKLKKNINSHMLVIDQIGGAGNLPYKLTILKNSLCVFHCFLDHDEAGIKAYSASEKDGLLSVKNNTFIMCKGSPESEFEDCLDLACYEAEIQREFGVNLKCTEFRGNKKWSLRVKAAFLSQGKQWNNKIESQVKYTVANCVVKKPDVSLHPAKRSCIDALVDSLEDMIGG